jgi:predicted transposase/invertase (TIGR01784 family)
MRLWVRGNDYAQLKKTIAINILDFDFLPSAHFQSTFQLRDCTAPELVLADTIEIHFLECAKFRRITPDLRNPLHRWLLFLDERTPQQQIKELISMDASIKSVGIDIDKIEKATGLTEAQFKAD